MAEAMQAPARREHYHHGDLRAALVEAVRGLVESHGPDRFSLADACRAAGVSTAAPYRHFADKEAMLRAVALEGMERHRARMLAALAPHIPGSDAAMVAMGLAYIDFARAEPGVFRLMFGLTRGHGDHSELQAAGLRCYGVLLDQVAARMGLAAEDPQVSARAFPCWTFVHGLAFLMIDDKIALLRLDVPLPATLAEVCRRMLAEFPDPGA